MPGGLHHLRLTDSRLRPPPAATGRDDGFECTPPEHPGDDCGAGTGDGHQNAARHHHGRHREQRRQRDQGRSKRPARPAGLPPHQRGDDHQAHPHRARERTKRRTLGGRPDPGSRFGRSTGGARRAPAVEREKLKFEYFARQARAPRRVFEPDPGKHHDDETRPPRMQTTERHSTCLRIGRTDIEAHRANRELRRDARNDVVRPPVSPPDTIHAGILVSPSTRMRVHRMRRRP